MLGPFTYHYRMSEDYYLPFLPPWRTYTVQSAESYEDATMQFWEAVGPTARRVTPLFQCAMFSIVYLLLPYVGWGYLQPMLA